MHVSYGCGNGFLVYNSVEVHYGQWFPEQEAVPVVPKVNTLSISVPKVNTLSISVPKRRHTVNKRSLK